MFYIPYSWQDSQSLPLSADAVEQQTPSVFAIEPSQILLRRLVKGPLATLYQARWNLDGSSEPYDDFPAKYFNVSIPFILTTHKLGTGQLICLRSGNFNVPALPTMATRIFAQIPLSSRKSQWRPDLSRRVVDFDFSEHKGTIMSVCWMSRADDDLPNAVTINAKSARNHLDLHPYSITSMTCR